MGLVQYYIFPGIDEEKQKQYADREIAAGKPVIIHYHHQGEPCIEKCWDNKGD